MGTREGYRDSKRNESEGLGKWRLRGRRAQRDVSSSEIQLLRF